MGRKRLPRTALGVGPRLYPTTSFPHMFECRDNAAGMKSLSSQCVGYRQGKFPIFNTQSLLQPKPHLRRPARIEH